MTTNRERRQALIAALELLGDLTDPKKTPRVPKAIRSRASSCLRHYPWPFQIQESFGNRQTENFFLTE